MILSVMLALGLAAPARLDRIDRQLGDDRAALARTQAPVVQLLATVQRLLLAPPTAARDAALQREAALLRIVEAATADRLDALGERIDALAAARAEAVIRAALGRRGVHVSRPAHVAPVERCASGAFRMPVDGLALTGQTAATLGHPLGITLVALPGEAVSAPAGGRIAYAGAFRRYGGVVILDHGHGWTTLLTGLDAVTAVPNRMAAAGEALGRVPRAEPFVTVELSHHGRAVDPLAMLRQCSPQRAGARAFPRAAGRPT